MPISIIINMLTHSSNLKDMRRITANLPKNLLEEALKVTQKGITDTLVEGLQLIRRRRAYQKAMKLKGKLHLNLNLDQARERNHR